MYKAFPITVELGYNDHGYNEYTFITNKFCSLVWFSLLNQYSFMVIAYKMLENHGYNEQSWKFMGLFNEKNKQVFCQKM